MLVPRQEKHLPAKNGLTRIDIPVRRVALTSPMYAALIKPLNVLDSVVGVNAQIKHCRFDEIEGKLRDGSMVSLGNGNSLDYEKLALLKPDLVFADNWDPKVHAKLDELEIPFAVVDCYGETHPLGRMEWMKFLAAFYDREEEANAYFKAAFDRVNTILNRTGSAKRKPSVLCGGIYDGKVHVPGPDACTAKMIEMGGGHYAFRDSGLVPFMGGYCNITLEEFFIQGKTSDVYVYEAGSSIGITSIEKLIAGGDILSTIRPVLKGNVWISQPGYWQALNKMDEVILDLAYIFHPALFPDHKPLYFRKLPRKD